ncbi:MAG: efflux RND transporter periplasmic adaptor subunit [Sphingomonadales bacterium]
MRRWILFSAVLAVFGALIAFNLVLKPKFIQEAIYGDGPPVATVSAQPAALRDWEPTLAAVGTVAAVQGAVLSPRESGIVTKISFQSGQMVTEGDLLVQIDDEAQRADVRLFEATLRNAELELSRTKELVKKQEVSEAALDRVIAARDEAYANLERAKAQVEDQAIRAPFSGRLGIRRVNVGQFVDTGDPIVSLQTLDPIYVTFEMPENLIGKLAVGQTMDASVDAYPGQRFNGAVTSIDSSVDVNTRSISVQATLRNPDGFLTPGMFASVRVSQPTQYEVVTVPQTAIAYSLYGDTVWILSEEEGTDFYTARREIVRPQEGDEGEIVVVGKVSAGDLVVTAGQNKIRPGWKIRVNNDVLLANKDGLPQE